MEDKSGGHVTIADKQPNVREQKILKLEEEIEQLHGRFRPQSGISPL